MKKIKVGGKEFNVKEARTEEEKEKGLQGVKELPENEGMLFIFDPPEDVSMWMKDTLIPLDIVFINDEQEVTHVEEGVPNTETPMTVNDTAYVLEVNKDSGIKEGDELEMEDNEDGPVMKVLAQDGSTQMDLWGGERIFSRKNTVILIKKAKKADLSKDDKDYKALGRYMFKCIKGQDERPPEYVQSPEESNKDQ